MNIFYNLVHTSIGFHEIYSTVIHTPLDISTAIKVVGNFAIAKVRIIAINAIPSYIIRELKKSILDINIRNDINRYKLSFNKKKKKNSR